MTPACGCLEGNEFYKNLLEAVKHSVTVQSELRDTVANLSNTVKDLKGAINSLANRNYNEMQFHTNQLKIMDIVLSSFIFPR